MPQLAFVLRVWRVNLVHELLVCHVIVVDLHVLNARNLKTEIQMFPVAKP